MKRTKAAAAPQTLAAIYRAATGDLETHQTTIAAHFRRLEKRRQKAITLRMAGHALAEIGVAIGASTGAAALSCILLACRSMKKAIAHEPRYNQVGRPTGYRRVDQRAGNAIAKRQQAGVRRSQAAHAADLKKAATERQAPATKKRKRPAR